MLITKSLYVDYQEDPKLAWWKHHDQATYKHIQGLEDEEVEAGIIELGQQVEDLIGDYLQLKYGLERYDVFQENPINEQENEGEDNDLLVIQPQYKTLFEKNLIDTREAIARKEPLIYQPGFLYNNLYVRADYLRLNPSGQYELLEVKAKTGVRKTKTHEKIKNKNAGDLESKFYEDASFQKYVINQSLASWGEEPLEKIFYCYLNHQYKLKGKLDILKLVVEDQVDHIHTVTLMGEESTKEVEMDDTLRHYKGIEAIVQKMQEELPLSESEFNALHPFTGSKYIQYFGTERPAGTIFSKGLNASSAVKHLYTQGTTQLHKLQDEDLDLFNRGDGSYGTARLFVNNYLRSYHEKAPIILKDQIQQELDKLQYPLCFYDYESVSVPIPYFENTSPYQQVVVQYSLHKVYEDGRIEHYGGIYVGDEFHDDENESPISQVTIPDNTNAVERESEKVVHSDYRLFLDQFVADIGTDIDGSSFIVWHKPFENTRNKEIAQMFPDLEDVFLKINESTYDLKEIFQKGYYFDTQFKGSCSIKYVLPVMVPEMSYEGLEVPNGMIAMKQLFKLIEGQIQGSERLSATQELLRYCGQDSLAMVKIYDALFAFARDQCV